MKAFQLSILASDRDFYEGECESLIVPTYDGYVGILADHSNLIEGVCPGELKFKLPGGEERIAIVTEGMIKVEDGEVLVLVDTAERPDEVEANKIKRQKAREQEALLQKKSHEEYLQTQMTLIKTINKMKKNGEEK